MERIDGGDVATLGHFDELENKLVIERVQDVEPILAHTQRLANEGGRSKSGELYHAASLPKVLVEKYCNDHNITFAEWLSNPDHVKAMLRDPDLTYFRIWKGKV